MRPDRGGFGLVGVILLILILTGVGMVISYMARHADRSGRWFQHSQMSFGLADAGLKQALYLLSDKNSKARAAEPGPATRTMTQVFEALSKGQTGTSIVLFSSSTPAELPPGLTAQLDPLAAEYSPTLDVTLEVLEGAPLYDGAKNGIALIEGERQGDIRITSRASVKTPVGIRVERVLTLEKGFKVVSVLPPLLGRFGLFVDPRVAMDPNVFSVRFDDVTGDGIPEPGNVPLILRSKTVGTLVQRGGFNLDRAGFVNAIADPKFLDSQGWVYLGPGDAMPQGWTLKLTHGFGAAGESVLLPGVRYRTPFKNDAEEKGFRQRFDDAFKANALEGCQSDLVLEENLAEGLEHFHHGWATNYEIIGLDPNSLPLVGGGTNRTKCDFGPGTSSMLRCYGTPDACSPTVVFGPVYSSCLRRASIYALVGPPEYCQISGYFRFNLFKLADHDGKFQAVLNAAFAGAYDDWGTAVEAKNSYADKLNVLLTAQGAGEYAPDGILDRKPDTGAAKAFASDHFTWAAQLGTGVGLPQADVEALINGRLNAPKIYDGNLSAGLLSFQAVLEAKQTYEIRPDAFKQRLLGGQGGLELSVPGIVKVGSDPGGEVVIPAGTVVKRGGILMVPGNVRIDGDVRRAGDSEPLTIVSLKGDISVAPGARLVEAVLVTVAGKVDLQGGALINGGIATRELDFARLRALPEPVIIEHALQTDPVGPFRDASLRAFYGGEDRIVASGSGL